MAKKRNTKSKPRKKGGTIVTTKAGRKKKSYDFQKGRGILSQILQLTLAVYILDLIATYIEKFLTEQKFLSSDGKPPTGNTVKFATYGLILWAHKKGWIPVKGIDIVAQTKIATIAANMFIPDMAPKAGLGYAQPRGAANYQFERTPAEIRNILEMQKSKSGVYVKRGKGYVQAIV